MTDEQQAAAQFPIKKDRAAFDKFFDGHAKCTSTRALYSKSDALKPSKFASLLALASGPLRLR